MQASWSEPLARKAVFLWERSRNFTPGPVSHPVRVRLSEHHFPTAWRAGGEWEREDIIECIRWLESRGVARVTQSSRGGFATPVSVLLLPEAIEDAYALLGGHSRRYHGGELLGVLEEAAADATGWWREYLEVAAAEVANGQFGRLGHRAYENESYDYVRDALRVIPALLRGTPFEERTFSAAVLKNSKRFNQVRKRVRQILLRADPYWAGRAVPSDRVLFGHYGERFKPPMTSIAAALNMPSIACLARFEPYAVLPDAVLLEFGIGIGDGTAFTALGMLDRITLTTIENEWVFLRYLEEPDVGQRVRAGEEIVLYTAGAPSAGVLRFIRAARARIGLRHWGDCDVYGLRFGLTLCAAAKGGELFRSAPDVITGCAAIASQALDAAHIRQLESLLDSDRLHLARGLAQTAAAVLEARVWVEQEIYYAWAGSRVGTQHGMPIDEHVEVLEGDSTIQACRSSSESLA